MSGFIGSVVKLQTPWSSFCIGNCLPPIDTATSLAFGARRRKVTRLSAAISGDFTGGAPQPPRPTDAADDGERDAGEDDCWDTSNVEQAIEQVRAKPRLQMR